MRLCRLNGLFLTENNCYTVVSGREGSLKDFSFIEFSQYGSLMVTKEFSSASELLDYFYFQRDKTVRLKQRANDLFKFLANTSERITKETGRSAGRTEKL